MPHVVAHVIESFGGGSLTSMLQMVAAVPTATHHVVMRPRAGEHIDGGELEQFASVTILPPGTLAPVAAVRRAIRSINPTVVHAHSSKAGVYSRLATLSTRRRRIVYSPHCFAFERRDLTATQRTALRGAEWLLAWNTHAIAACSPHELLSVRRWPFTAAEFVPNVAPAGSAPAPGPRPSAAPGIVGMGRLGPQKDPEFFLAACNEIRARRPGTAATWIGGGPGALESRLLASDIDVTGWLSHADGAARLRGAAVYLHTAAWEGFPMAILEAAQLERPIVARRIPAFHGAPADWLADSPGELAELAGELLDSPEMRAANQQAWSDALRMNNRETQAARLAKLYGPDVCR